jgi:hypothetical protein
MRLSETGKEGVRDADSWRNLESDSLWIFPVGSWLAALSSRGRTELGGTEKREEAAGDTPWHEQRRNRLKDGKEGFGPTESAF